MSTAAPTTADRARRTRELADAVDHMAARSKLGDSVVEVPRSLYDAVIDARAAVEPHSNEVHAQEI